MTWHRSLRARLTALFIAVAGGAILAAALGMGMLVERTGWRTLDAELDEEGETVCSLLATASLDSVQRAATSMVREASPGPGKFVLVRGHDGTIVAHAGVVPASVIQRHPGESGHGRLMQLGDAEEAYRVVWHPSPDCTAVVGAVASGHQKTLARAQMMIAGGAGALLVLIGALAWVVTSRATAEIDRMAAEVETIEAGSLSRRLSGRQTLEVDRLAAVLNRLLGRLEASMSHLRRFTADAAHELRTPIAGLRARLEVTLGGPNEIATYRNGVLDALEQTERLGRLAADLLELSRVEATGAGTMETVRLDVLAREAADFMEPVAHEQHRPFACDAATPVTVQGAPGLLKRLLLNVVGNAFQHTPPAAAVRLVVRTDDADAVVDVIDRGPGIADEELPHVFTRFHRGREAGPGTGLGLALCREIVAQHHGTIVVTRAASGGTQVTVRLPLAPGSPPASSPPPASTAA